MIFPKQTANLRGHDKADYKGKLTDFSQQKHVEVKRNNYHFCNIMFLFHIRNNN